MPKRCNKNQACQMTSLNHRGTQRCEYAHFWIILPFWTDFNPLMVKISTLAPLHIFISASKPFRCHQKTKYKKMFFQGSFSHGHLGILYMSNSKTRLWLVFTLFSLLLLAEHLECRQESWPEAWKWLYRLSHSGAPSHAQKTFLTPPRMKLILINS